MTYKGLHQPGGGGEVCQILMVDDRGEEGSLAYLISPDDTHYNTSSGGERGVGLFSEP